MPDTALKHITTCRICGHPFTNWQVDVPIMGQPPSARVAQFVGALAKHLQSKHADKMQAVQIGGQEFMGMLIMMLFSTTDPNLLMTVEQVRAAVSKLCTEPMERANLVTP